MHSAMLYAAVMTAAIRLVKMFSASCIALSVLLEENEVISATIGLLHLLATFFTYSHVHPLIEI